MPVAQMDAMIQTLRRTLLRQERASGTDSQLLASFIDRNDDVAFHAIVLRHGPMVLGVCNRITGNNHDAEDAFQATFLVLARKASSVTPGERLANWLHGVAQRIAMKAKVQSAKRRVREKQVPDLPDPRTKHTDQWSDLRPLIDQELDGLPEYYRLPIVLCDLEGLTIKEATQRLGWPQGTVAGRLARGRKLLARRLASRGVTLSVGTLALVVAQNVAAANVPAPLVTATVKDAITVATGKTAVSGVVSAKIAALVEGMVGAMLVSKLKIAAIWLFVSVIVLGAGLLTYQVATAHNANAAVQEPESPSAKPKRQSNEKAEVNAKKEVADQDRLQGKWRVVACTCDGESVPGEIVRQVKIEFKGNKMKVQSGLAFHAKQIQGKDEKKITFGISDIDYEMAIKLDPTSNPKGIVLAMRDGVGGGIVTKGIYSLDGDKLTMCNSNDGKAPTNFKCGRGSNRILYVMEREPASKKAAHADGAAIQGAWKVVAVERQGRTWRNVDGEFVCEDKSLPAAQIRLENPHQTIFSGESCTWRFFEGPGKTVTLSGTVTLDPARTPKWITHTGKDGFHFYGIYTLDRDEMRVCWQVGNRSNLRPTNFTTRKEPDRDDDTEVWVLRRQSALPGEKVEILKEALRIIPTKQTWDGILENRKLLKESPPVGHVLNTMAWEKLWKGWRPKEPLPAIDFDKQIVIVLTVPGPNKISPPELVINEEGNLKVPLPVSTLIGDDGRVGYKLIVIDREGVHSVNGRPIPKREPSF